MNKISKTKKIEQKLLEWIKRYLPAEIIGTIAALIGAELIIFFTNDKIAAAFAGSITESIGFYGLILLREHHNDAKKFKKASKKYGILGNLKTIRNLCVEFGFSEIFDTLFIRPFCMYIFPIIIGRFAIGIIVGKIAADLVFYIFTIIAYELRKKVF